MAEAAKKTTTRKKAPVKKAAAKPATKAANDAVEKADKGAPSAPAAKTSTRPVDESGLHSVSHDDLNPGFAIPLG